MFPDMMKGLLSKCLCQQLKINPDPTHKENLLEKSWRSCVAYGEVYTVTFVHRTRNCIADGVRCLAPQNTA